MTEAKKPRWPHASVFVLVDEHGKVVVSFDRSPDSQKESLELPHQADRLVALHAAVIKAARALTGAKSDEEAVPKLLEYAKEEERKRLQPPTAVPTPPSGTWRASPQRNVGREYPVGSDSSRREIPSGLPDSKRRRH
ncbi:hypothetical protein [Micromonospora inositola]|uniref:hypothetical protein n=1 Tax=Micromonospora inositola TaxID=47865 RepID=UPI0012FD1978|nr:hypothetical protein [Micromonospora inositola]